MANICTLDCRIHFRKEEYAASYEAYVNKLVDACGNTYYADMTGNGLFFDIHNVERYDKKVILIASVRWMLNVPDAVSLLLSAYKRGANEFLVYYEEFGECVFGKYHWSDLNDVFRDTFISQKAFYGGEVPCDEFGDYDIDRLADILEDGVSDIVEENEVFEALSASDMCTEILDIPSNIIGGVPEFVLGELSSTLMEAAPRPYTEAMEHRAFRDNWRFGPFSVTLNRRIANAVKDSVEDNY